MATDSETVALDDSPEFDPSRCLFCGHKSADMDDNLGHMHRAHGLFIPDQDQLAVDVETLLAYFDLVIFGYMECLYCGSQRRTVDAVQQHMRGKAHCRFDLDDEESEFWDLYSFPRHETDDDGDVDADAQSALAIRATTPSRPGQSDGLRPVDDSLRLPSGKLVLQRTVRPLRSRQQRRRLAEDIVAEPLQQSYAGAPSSAADAVQVANSPTEMTRSERRAQDYGARQLGHLRATDRQSLGHLSVAEQRAVLASQKKQLDQARRADRAQQSRVESLGNRTLMVHFVSDVPGRKNG